MRDYGKISSSIWRSKKFRGLTNDDARLLYFYLHTCPHANSAGCFVLPLGYIQADLEWDEQRSVKAMESLSEAYLVSWDRAESVVLIVNFLEHDPFTNHKHAMGAVKAAISLPDCEQKLSVLQELASIKFASDDARLKPEIESLSKGYRKAIPPEPIPIPIPEPIPEPEREGVTSSASNALGQQTEPKTPKRSPTGTRLPDDWLPSPELATWTKTEFPGVNPITELQKFTDYWRAKPGAGGRKADWDATWRNWIRRASESRQAVRPRHNEFETRDYTAGVTGGTF